MIFREIFMAILFVIIIALIIVAIIPQKKQSALRNTTQPKMNNSDDHKYTVTFGGDRKSLENNMEKIMKKSVSFRDNNLSETIPDTIPTTQVENDTHDSKNPSVIPSQEDFDKKVYEKNVTRNSLNYTANKDYVDLLNSRLDQRKENKLYQRVDRMHGSAIRNNRKF